MGAKVQLAVRRVDLDMSTVALYKSLAGQMGVFCYGMVDLQRPRPKKDWSQQTEGVFTEVTPQLLHFLTTGQG